MQVIDFIITLFGCNRMGMCCKKKTGWRNVWNMR